MDELHTLDDYLRTYKDISTSEYNWNEIDCLFCSLLAYAHLNNIEDNIPFNEFANQIEIQLANENYGRLVPKLVYLANLVKDSTRYKDMLVKNYKYIIDDNTQFGAMVFVTNNKAIVSFTGSDGSVIGWYENLRCSYMFPIYSQNKAKEYLLSIIDVYDDITILGHSKGGNLAISSALGLDDNKLEKIKHIYNFDGQGFFKEIIASNDYKKIENKIINFIPERSYIGSLMYHGNNIKYIKTTCKGIDVHFQFNWCIDNGVFTEGKGLFKPSERIHTMTTVRFEKLDKVELYSVIENAINALDIDRTSKLKIKTEDLVQIIKLNHKNKLITIKEIRTVLKTFLSIEK